MNNNFTLPEILTQSRFYVELKLGQNTEADAFFMECKGFKYSHELIEFFIIIIPIRDRL